MKMKITSICVAIMFFMTAFSAKADVFYVVSGVPFNLKPDVTNLLQYNWELTENGNVTTTVLDAASQGIFSKTFTLPQGSTTVVKNKLTLSVLNAVQGCLSALVEHTIVVLPQLTATIGSNVATICEGTTVAAKLTANVVASLVDGLGVGYTYAWYKGTELISGATSESLDVTTVGEYICKVVYQTPSGSQKHSSVLTAITQGTKSVVVTPLASVPLLTID
ncbi:hypothetical protein [Dyadobacter psychrotolerans]|uniref:Ig-like domain-containing protein n=1 Tax=Dyadobacter psychrotolerans TaxID=2541721 RepID=A0A4R5DYI6_9BACT|nr:hypothetical protein [Dyadobacter psychrotolerans]TDE17560.1 hypothetical protein E0F88_06625 [Dyadobacter psychrotolerans]